MDHELFAIQFNIGNKAIRTGYELGLNYVVVGHNLFAFKVCNSHRLTVEKYIALGQIRRITHGCVMPGLMLMRHCSGLCIVSLSAVGLIYPISFVFMGHS